MEIERVLQNLIIKCNREEDKKNVNIIITDDSRNDNSYAAVTCSSQNMPKLTGTFPADESDSLYHGRQFFSAAVLQMLKHSVTVAQVEKCHKVSGLTIVIAIFV